MEPTPDSSCSSSLREPSPYRGGRIQPMSSQKSNSSSLPQGVYVPMLAFFTSSDEIDRHATERHAARLIASGVAGLVVHGSNGEAAHLSPQERIDVIQAVAAVAHAETDATRVPVIAGCGAQSVRETLTLCRDAASAGATHALVLPPGYYASLLKPDAVVRFFHAVADESPIPILIYNFPAAANGVDLSSDVILRIAAHPRVVGVKLTCGNTGKLARVASGARRLRSASWEPFFVAGGSADFILPGLAVGAHGTISGFANLAPRACVRLFELWEAGRLDEARDLQAVLAEADWLAIRYGFIGVKAAMRLFYGDGERACAVPRMPFVALDESGAEVGEIAEGMKGAVELEKNLRATARDAAAAAATAAAALPAA